MSSRYCDQERRVAAAIGSGTAGPEILNHARVCSVCSEVLLVTVFLRETGTLAEHELSALPDAGSIWRKAEAQARTRKIAKATQPIRLVRSIAYVVVTFYSVWIVLVGLVQGKLVDFWSMYLGFTSTFVGRIWPAVLHQATILFIFGGTMVFLALSSWYVLREG